MFILHIKSLFILYIPKFKKTAVFAPSFLLQLTHIYARSLIIIPKFFSLALHRRLFVCNKAFTWLIFTFVMDYLRIVTQLVNFLNNPAEDLYRLYCPIVEHSLLITKKGPIVCPLSVLTDFSYHKLPPSLKLTTLTQLTH